MNRAAAVASERLAEYFYLRHAKNPIDEAEGLLRQIDARRSWHTPSHLASQAWHLLQHIRIDVDDFIENYLKVTLRIEQLHSLDERVGAEVLGCADVRHRTIRICERTLKYEPLYRATAMHEVGHILLHGIAEDTVHAYAPDAADRPPQEREADDFMVASVLPWEAVQLSVAATALEWNLNLSAAFPCANTAHGRYQWHVKYLPELQVRMGVSKHLAALRLRRRGVISEETLSYHLKTGSPGWTGPTNASCSKYHISHAIDEVMGNWR